MPLPFPLILPDVWRQAHACPLLPSTRSPTSLSSYRPRQNTSPMHPFAHAHLRRQALPWPHPHEAVLLRAGKRRHAHVAAVRRGGHLGAGAVRVELPAVVRALHVTVNHLRVERVGWAQPALHNKRPQPSRGASQNARLGPHLPSGRRQARFQPTGTPPHAVIRPCLFFHAPAYARRKYENPPLPPRFKSHAPTFPSESGQARCAHSSLTQAGLPCSSRNMTHGSPNRSNGTSVSLVRRCRDKNASAKYVMHSRFWRSRAARCASPPSPLRVQPPQGGPGLSCPNPGTVPPERGSCVLIGVAVLVAAPTTRWSCSPRPTPQPNPLTLPVGSRAKQLSPLPHPNPQPS